MTKRPTPRKSRGKPANRKPAAKAAAKPRAGRGAEATATRRRAFAAAYLTNGHNATAAAITAGCAKKGAAGAGYRLLQSAEVQTLLGARAEKVAELAKLTTATWAYQLAAVMNSNFADLYNSDGELIPVHLLPRHVQAAICGIKETKYGREYKLWDKGAAIQTAARHLGLYERDNAQQSDITVRVELVG